MRRLVLILPVVVFAGLIAVFGWLLLFADNGERDPSTIPSALIGKPVPQFTLPAVAAGIPGGFSTADLKGRPVIVNVFASWCVPCRAEHPVIKQLAADGYTVYGIDFQDKPADAADYLSRFGNPYKAVGSDANGRVGIDWGVTGVPETYIVDADGIIRFKYPGPLTPDLVTRMIKPVLDKVAR